MTPQQIAEKIADQLYLNSGAVQLVGSEEELANEILDVLESLNLTAAPKVEGSKQDRREKRNRELEAGGGLAFPTPIVTVDGSVYDSEEYCAGNGGMTLRDYFAAKVLPGVCKEFYDDTDLLFLSEQLAEEAYSIADAMLKAREIPRVEGTVTR